MYIIYNMTLIEELKKIIDAADNDNPDLVSAKEKVKIVYELLISATTVVENIDKEIKEEKEEKKELDAEVTKLKEALKCAEEVVVITPCILPSICPPVITYTGCTDDDCSDDDCSDDDCSDDDSDECDDSDDSDDECDDSDDSDECDDGGDEPCEPKKKCIIPWYIAVSSAMFVILAGIIYSFNYYEWADNTIIYL